MIIYYTYYSLIVKSKNKIVFLKLFSLKDDVIKIV